MGWQRPVLADDPGGDGRAGDLRPMGTAVTLVGLCTFGYVCTMIDRVLIFRRGSGGAADRRHRRRGPGDSRRRPAALHGPGAGVQRAGGGGRPHRGHGRPGVSAREATGAVAAGGRRRRDASRPRRRAQESDAITIVLVPPADPRTKPKACNYGLHFATGEIITIYDAEDCPSRCSCAASSPPSMRCPTTVACMQAKLAYHNGHQNLLTGWFTAEYGLWFGYLLPGLMRTNSPIPLGGTSNHLRTSGAGQDRRVGSVQRHRGRRPGAAHRRDRATTPRSSTRSRWRRPTAIRSTGSGSDPVGTRVICRPGWCTCADPASCCAPSAGAASSGSTWWWGAPRSSRCSTWRSG